MINWKVRIKNKNFWFAIIPAVALLIQAIATLFGFTLDLSDFSGKMLVVVDCVFVVLAILGIVNDPTTAGISDSSRAMTYDEPKNY
jgi:phi LC3 family holin